jgi:hypothetical protein
MKKHKRLRSLHGTPHHRSSLQVSWFYLTLRASNRNCRSRGRTRPGGEDHGLACVRRLLGLYDNLVGVYDPSNTLGWYIESARCPFLFLFFLFPFRSFVASFIYLFSTIVFFETANIFKSKQFKKLNIFMIFFCWNLNIFCNCTYFKCRIVVH